MMAIIPNVVLKYQINLNLAYIKFLAVYLSILEVYGLNPV